MATLHRGQLGERAGLVHKSLMVAAGHTSPGILLRMSSIEAADHTSPGILLDRIAEGVRTVLRRQMLTKGDSSPLGRGSRLQE